MKKAVSIKFFKKPEVLNRGKKVNTHQVTVRKLNYFRKSR